MKIYRDKDGDLKILGDRSIVVIGYGNQGTAFANNLRDSGLNVSVALREKSPSIAPAAEDGFPVISNEDAHSADVILMMIPDHLHGDFYDACLRGRLGPDQVVVFAHGYSIHFGLIAPENGVRYLLVAPHGPGKALRSRFLDGSGISCYVAGYPINSGVSLRTALAIAKACGCTRIGAFKTTFEHEAIGDLFGEQALLCGGLSHLLAATFETLVENGIPRENAYLETVHQLELLAGLIRSGGITGMLEKISRTAQFGTALSEKSFVGTNLRSEFQKLYDDIASGKFAGKWAIESAKGCPETRDFTRRIRSSALEKTALRMRKVLDDAE